VKHRPNFGAGFGALIWFGIVAVPIYVLISASLRPQAGYLAKGPISPITSPTLSNFSHVLDTDFPRYLLNTFVITFAVVGIVLVLALPIAYAVVRGTGWMNRGTFRLFLLGLAIPSQAVIIPLFLIINQMGLYDTLWAVILPTGSVRSAPERADPDRQHARHLPGALRGHGDRRGELDPRLLPPGPAAYAVRYLDDRGVHRLAGMERLPLPAHLDPVRQHQSGHPGLYQFISQYGANIPALFAGVLLSAMPILVVYLFARRTLVSGLMGVGGK